MGKFGVFLLLAAVAAIPTRRALSQNPTVTFYTPGSVAKDLLKGASPVGNFHTSFYGWVFRGQEHLAYIVPGRFITLELPAGEYVFGASFSNKMKPKDGSVPMKLEPDRLTSSSWAPSSTRAW